MSVSKTVIEVTVRSVIVRGNTNIDEEIVRVTPEMTSDQFEEVSRLVCAGFRIESATPIGDGIYYILRRIIDPVTKELS